MENFFYKVNDIDYPVIITYKRIKNIHYRFVDNSFRVSCNILASKRNIIQGLDKFATSLIERSAKPKAKDNDFIYLFGIKISLQESGVIKFTDGSELVYKNHNDLNKKIRNLYLSFMKERVAYYSKLMGVPLYKVTVRDMKTRFGSNSKYTKSLHFSTVLVHYSVPIIDSVIVHELAHIKVYNHSKAFYDVVYKYSPNYKEYRKKLLRGEFQ